MIRQFALGLVAATALFAVEAATFQAEAQQRRRGVPEVRVSRPSWLVTPKVSFPATASAPVRTSSTATPMRTAIR